MLANVLGRATSIRLVAAKVPVKLPTASLASSGATKVQEGTIEDVKAQVSRWEKVHDTYFGPERDTKNFPLYKAPESSPATRVGFIPESWFNFFYPKTGVTGPYLFMGGALTFLMGKEIWVVDHYFPEVLSFSIMVYIINRKFGKQIGEFFDDSRDRMVKGAYLDPLAEAKQVASDKIDGMQKYVEQQSEYRRYMYAALKEQVMLNMEAQYRERLTASHKAVVKRLDYQAERENIRRKAEQEHMVQWIVGQVNKAITPQLEKEAVTQCIANLRNIAARNKAATA